MHLPLPGQRLCPAQSCGAGVAPAALPAHAPGAPAHVPPPWHTGRPSEPATQTPPMAPPCGASACVAALQISWSPGELGQRGGTLPCQFSPKCPPCPPHRNRRLARCRRLAGSLLAPAGCCAVTPTSNAAHACMRDCAKTFGSFALLLSWTMRTIHRSRLVLDPPQSNRKIRFGTAWETLSNTPRSGRFDSISIRFDSDRR